MKTIAVVLSGCGVQDGSEIHEAVCTLLALSRRGARAVCAAPEGPQARVVDHSTGAAAQQKRDMLVESARIARGEITALSQLDPDKLDGLIMPGGYGAALNLSDFAVAGADMKIQPDLKRLLDALCGAGKPLAALCIAPPILAKLMQSRGVKGARLTIGSDRGTASKLEAMGATHVEARANQAVVDEKNKLVSAPAYMLASNVAELNEGIDKSVEELLRLA